jgi:hypothetical protein
LNYCFLGRPAYKDKFESEGEYWEFPSCIILDYNSVPIKRLFPFDTGGFNQYPNFIKLMNMIDFEATSTIDASQRLIGSFFLNPSNYFKPRPRTRSDFEWRFEIGVLDEEIKALYKLILSKSGKYDDRRFSIEIQSDGRLALTKNVLAVVFPEEYCESEEFMAYVERELGAVLLPYQTFPLKKSSTTRGRYPPRLG